MNKITSLPFKILVLSAFFLSGGLGLIYEVLWNRYLAVLLGTTSLSQLVVLMVFMGGLSLGALLFGRLVDRRSHQGLIYFGVLELLVGLYAVSFPQIFSWFKENYLTLATYLESGSTALLSLKLTVATLLIFLPAVAMGGTLPAVTRYLTRSQSGLRSNISVLYGVNNLGAVIGVLLGGFYLVHAFGMDRSMIYAGLCNIGLGSLLLAMAWHSKVRPEMDFRVAADYSRRAVEHLDTTIYKPYAAHRAVIAAAVSSFTAMALQVVLIRYFIIVLGATHSSFTIVVAAFIFGIGLGSLLVSSKLVGMTPLPTLLTSIFALTAGFMGVGLLFFGRVPFEISRAMSIFAPTPLAWPAYEFLRFGICFMLMLPITLASGMILPICVRIAGRGVVHIGRDVAMVYAASTMAALLGVLVTSQLLIRIFTLPHTLQFIMFIYVITAISLAFVLKEKGKKRIFAFIWILILAHISFWRPWSPDSLFVDRLNFVKYPYLDYKDFQQTNQTHVIVEERQGPEVQVVVMDVLNEIGSLCRSMYINGKPDASNDPFGPDLETEILLGQLPMLLHPAPANVFVLGVGSGITSGESLNHPAVRKVTTVELAEEVFEAAKNFANDNHRFWENPKHRIVIDDGKNFLALTKEKFDVIAMEPTNIWQEGMAGLFSEDFFRLVKSRLADGGIVAQWLHTYKVDDLSLNIVLKSFSRVFPKASIFSTSNGGDILLVGYDENWKFDALKMEHDFYRPGIWEPMRKAGNYSVVDVLLREMMSRESFREYTEALEVPINTENFPVLEYAAEFAYFMRQPSSLLEGRDSRLDTDNDDLLLHLFFKQLEPNPVQWRKLLDSNILVRNLRLKNSLLFKLLNMSGPEEQQKTLLPRLDDPLLKEVFLHPNYRRDPAEMSKDEIYYRLGGDLLIWSRAASQIWTPSFERMQKMYSMLATGEDPRQDGLLALKIAINLGQERSCGAALYFFRQAEAAGVMTAANMNEFDVSTAFTCEVKEGDLQRALTFWKVIAENGFVVLDETRLAKNILNIKLGGEPPPPYYGRLPERF